MMAIETSCDETSVAIVRDGNIVLSNIISSQIETHQKFGGVVPEVASRKHLEHINQVIREALNVAGISFKDLNAVAVANGPGLVGALLVGLSAAKAIAYALDIPLIAVNHLEGHIYANFIENPSLEFPLVCLIVSGGHTDLLLMAGHGNYQVLGRTRDDAAGEAFDKVARFMGLGYPGGPVIDKLAIQGDLEAISFPQAYLEDGSFDFSFSGLKSSVINYIHNAKQKNEEIHPADLAASFQNAVVTVLVNKVIKAVEVFGAKTVILAGGVAANSFLRARMKEASDLKEIRLFYPVPRLCTDNAAMIGCAAYFHYLRGNFADLSLNASPNQELL
ncbi:MAG: tRNA (adenosine(37)-N6)-threonylcarbamoyltransferase complex transferase subunit TsaD [Peptococcaceae bacterium]|nr:tRNA (adenosine(37)-N6)-threonylcarbamoyltransferase complex transferase subunit TsaD [Peptococcaceae bacterium]